MTEKEAAAGIHARPRGGERTLERMKKLTEKLGFPEKRLRAVHVAGSNGKGSTAAMIASALTAGGYRAGLYTSPYIREFRERFQIDGEMISPEDFVRITRKVLDAAEALDREGICCTEFECGTALAFCWFSEKRCDAAVLETGLGGKNDATNVIPRPMLSVITALSLEHTALLGNTLTEIAGEKAGIIKGGTAIVSPGQDPEAMAVLMEQCARTGAVLRSPCANGAKITAMDRRGLSFRYGEKAYRLSMTGTHQLNNALTALEALRALSDFFPLSQEEVYKGLEEARMPVRFETVSENPAVVLDGAHNPQGAEVLAKLLKSCPESPKIGLIGMLADKDWEQASRILAGCFDRVVAVPVENPRRCAEPEKLAEAMSEICPAEYRNTLREGLNRAREMAGEKGLICCAGSLFLSAQLRKDLVK